MAERKTREQAELEAYLRHARSFEKKLDDIRWNYEEFVPLLEQYKAGKLQLNFTKKPLFELEAAKKDDVQSSDN